MDASLRGRAISVVRAAVPMFVAAGTSFLALVPSVEGQSAVSFTELRPFVTGLIPVVGPGGVGGVSIDAKGAVSRSDVETLGRLREARLRAMKPVDGDLKTVSRMRKVSLRGLQAAIDELRRDGRGISDELQNLAGLQRLQYIFVYPEQRDIVIAGFAEGWKVDGQGNLVGETTRQPVLQLDDMIVALRTARASSQAPITCSIDPTESGLKQLKRALDTRGVEVNEALVMRLEQSLGPQNITLAGVPPTSHFAQVMLAADYLMKRLAMNFEAAPVDGLPSFMEMLQTGSGSPPRNAMPRWWLASRYEPLLRDGDGLAWQIQGSVRAQTEEGFLSSAGHVVGGGKEGTLAKKWADTMTAKYESLSTALPVFGELQNCMDLAVLGALLVKEDLSAKANCDLSLLLDEKQLQVAAYHLPKTVDSRASLVRKGRQWIVSVSGGVEIDAWSALKQVQTRQELAQSRPQVNLADAKHWWWD
jgi:hypothetical protein